MATHLEGFQSQTDVPVGTGRTSLIREIGPTEAHLTNALLSWQRARDSTDPSVRISSLWQGLEQWVKGYREERPLFPPSLLKKIKAAVEPMLDEGQRQRIRDLLGDLNEPSLMRKLSALIEQGAIPVSKPDIDGLRRTRQVRNRVEHGNALIDLEVEDVRSAIALLERLLVYSLS